MRNMSLLLKRMHLRWLARQERKATIISSVCVCGGGGEGGWVGVGVGGCKCE